MLSGLVSTTFYSYIETNPLSNIVVNICFSTGELFAQAPVEQYPGLAVESVTDSSRYFVIRIEDGNGNYISISIL